MALFNLPKLLSKAQIVKLLPTGPRWFLKEDVETGELSFFIDAAATQIGLWLSAIMNLRKALFLNLAEGSDLDLWGQDLKLVRRFGESDEDYRTRLRKELLRVRVTRPGVKSIIEEGTGLAVEVIQPWEYEDIRDKAQMSLSEDQLQDFYGRSGMTVRTDWYYQGGVLNIKTYGFSQLTHRLAFEAVAAGVKVYFTVQLDETIAPAYDEVVGSQWLNPNWIRLVPIESDDTLDGLGGRSGVYDTGIVSKYRWDRTFDPHWDDPLTKASITFKYDYAVPLILDDPLALSGIKYKFDKTVLDDSTEPVVMYNPVFQKTLSMMPTLWDRPDIGLSFTYWGTTFTGDELKDYTWEEAVDPGHFAQVGSQLTTATRTP